jgi:hypothetical protein
LAFANWVPKSNLPAHAPVYTFTDQPQNPNTHTQEEHGPDCEGSEELTAAQAILDEVEPMLEV